VIRTVVDTNLLVSYLVSHHPPMSELLDVYLTRNEWVPLTATPLLQELDRVLQYPRLQRYYTAEARVRFVALVAALSELVELPDAVPRICRDPADDWVIACAVVGRADVMVSGDRHLLDLEQIADMPILSARQFWLLLQGR